MFGNASYLSFTQLSRWHLGIYLDSLLHTVLVVIVVSIIYLIAFILTLNSKISTININLRSHNPYFLFEKTQITIEADYRYLFNKCHEALRSMKYYIVEVNESKGTILAFRVFLWLPLSFKHFYFERDFVFPSLERYFVTLQTHIEKIENSDNRYKVFLEFTNEKDWINNSRETNSFINNLISKPKSKDEITMMNTEPSTSGES